MVWSLTFLAAWGSLAAPLSSAPGSSSCSGVVTYGTRPGQDYASIEMNATSTGGDTPLDCQAVCCNDPKCATWVYVPSGLYPNRPPGTFCWLKAAAIPLRGSTCDNGKFGCVSGVVDGRGNGSNSGGGYKPDLQWQPSYVAGSNGSLPSGVSSCAVGGGMVFVGQRGAGVEPILVLNAEGKAVRGFGIDEVHTIHGMKMQSIENGGSFLWTTDSGASTVSKWDPATGSRLATIGSKGTGLHPLQFGSVADVAFDTSGGVYISDGDGGINARVVKLDKNLAVVWANGNNGTVASSTAFKSPHSLAYDATANRIIVADRNNNQVRFLNADTGDLIGSWPPSVFAYPDCSLPSVWSVRTDSVTGQIFVGTSNFGSGAACTLPAGAAKRASILVIRPPPSGSTLAPANVTDVIAVDHGFPHEICVSVGAREVYAAAVDSADLPPNAGIGAVTRYVASV